jgi:hypothetical protein
MNRHDKGAGDNMKKQHIVGLVAIVAVLALTAIGASGASAFTKIEFNKAGTKNGFTGTLRTSPALMPELEAGGTVLVCKTETSKGVDGGNGTMTVSKVVVRFTGCEVGGLGSGKEVKSKGASKGEIVTDELSGTLGESATTESATGVSLDLEGPSGEFTTLEGAGLPISPAPITGSLAGEVTPINTSALSGTRVFSVTSGKQNIKKVCLLALPCGAIGGSEMKPELHFVGFATATLMTAETVTYEEATEVHAA